MKALGSEVLSRPDQVDEAAALSVAACLFHGFSDASRLAIVRHLVLGPHRVVDLVDHLGLAQSTVSKHLACLRDCGLVDSTPHGRASVFSLVPEVPLDGVLAAAEAVLASTRGASSDCRSVHEGGERD